MISLKIKPIHFLFFIYLINKIFNSLHVGSQWNNDFRVISLTLHMKQKFSQAYIIIIPKVYTNSQKYIITVDIFFPYTISKNTIALQVLIQWKVLARWCPASLVTKQLLGNVFKTFQNGWILVEMLSFLLVVYHSDIQVQCPTLLDLYCNAPLCCDRIAQ